MSMLLYVYRTLSPTNPYITGWYRALPAGIVYLFFPAPHRRFIQLGSALYRKNGFDHMRLSLTLIP